MNTADNEHKASPRNRGDEPRKFGAFGGVFAPCTLTILGVIMFLRYGQVVGQSGLLRALLILAVAKARLAATPIVAGLSSQNRSVHRH